MSAPRDAARHHVLVAGAGGIGCPAAWGLAAAGVGRVTLLDPDMVERSNLPRQVLFGEGDLGRPKAPVAAARLDVGSFASGQHARLDDVNAADLLADVDVLVDATDGAPAKDWINQAAVRLGVPLIHAAGLRSEARLLEVPAGGRPCLACLFGRLREETGSCADLGVWNGVVGTVGFLAAHAALRRARTPDRPSDGYVVLDFETGRTLTLGARAAKTCPVCAAAGDLEPYPAATACDLPTDAAPLREDVPAAGHLDLRTERCPLNLLRARQALDALAAGDVLAIRLGAEGAATVPDGVRALGHRVVRRELRGRGLDLLVQAGGSTSGADAMAAEDLQRFARQIVLPEVGAAGQRRLADAHIVLLGAGPAWQSARAYLRAAGVGRVSATAAGADVVAWAGGADVPADLRADILLEDVVAEDGTRGCRARRAGTSQPGGEAARGDAAAPVAVGLAWGTLLADLVERTLVLGEAAPMASFAVSQDGVPLEAVSPGAGTPASGTRD